MQVFEDGDQQLAAALSQEDAISLGLPLTTGALSICAAEEVAPAVRVPVLFCARWPT